MNYFKWTLWVLALSSLPLAAQVTAVTISGQQLVKSEDGSWEKINYSDTLNNADIKASESPYKKELSALIDKAESIERTCFAEYYYTQLNISKCMTAISKTQEQGDTEKTEKLKAILDKLNNQKDKDEKNYFQAADQIASVKKISSYKIKKQKSKIEEFYQKMGVDVQLEAYTSSMKKKKITYESAEIKKNKKNEVDCTYSRSQQPGELQYVELASLPFFTYTSFQSKPYFKDKELMNTRATLVQAGKKVYLKLQIVIISRDAAKNYGYIPRNSLMKIYFINGSNISLFADKETRYDIENYTGNAIYTILYPVQSDDLDTLKKVAVDKSGIAWSSGFEMYDVYEVDALIRLFRCLKSIN